MRRGREGSAGATYYFPTVAATAAPEMGRLETQTSIFSQFWMPETSNQGVGSFWKLRGIIASRLLSWLLTAAPILRVPWCVDTALRSMPLSSKLLPSAFLSTFSSLLFSSQHLSLDLGPTQLIQDVLRLKHLIQPHLQRPFFQIRSHSQVLGGQTVSGTTTGRYSRKHVGVGANGAGNPVCSYPFFVGKPHMCVSRYKKIIVRAHPEVFRMALDLW